MRPGAPRLSMICRGGVGPMRFQSVNDPVCATGLTLGGGVL